MAAGCKPAAPWSYGGSNPPLCTRTGLRVSFLDCARFIRIAGRARVDDAARSENPRRCAGAAGDVCRQNLAASKAATDRGKRRARSQFGTSEIGPARELKVI